MSVQELKALARKHWGTYLPSKVKALRESGDLEEALQGAANLAQTEPHQQLIDHGHVEYIERPPASASGLHTLRSLYH